MTSLLQRFGAASLAGAASLEVIMAKDKNKKNRTEVDEKIDDMTEKSAETAQDEAAPEQGDSVTLTREEFETARDEISKMRKSMQEAIEDAQRIQAEFNNYRKRNASIRSDSFDDGVRETIKSLLPVLDNFERAMLNADDTPFAAGIAQIQKQLIDCLNKSGLEQIETDVPFDPNLHEAVMRDEDGEAESGTITAVLQTGYRVKGRIIRHTMVRVKA